MVPYHSKYKLYTCILSFFLVKEALNAKIAAALFWAIMYLVQQM